MISVCVHNRGGVLDNVLLEIPAFNASKADPTRCGLLRKQFMSAMRVRFQSLYNDIHQWLVKNDSLSLNAYDPTQPRDREGKWTDLGKKESRRLMEEADKITSKSKAYWISKTGEVASTEDMEHSDYALKKNLITKKELAKDLGGWNDDEMEDVMRDLRPDSVMSSMFKKGYRRLVTYPEGGKYILYVNPGGISKEQRKVVEFYGISRGVSVWLDGGVEKGAKRLYNPPVENAGEYKFFSHSGKIKEFNKWLDQRINERLLQAYENNEPWIMDYVAEAYDKGYARAYDQVNAYGVVKKSPTVAGDKQGFVGRSLGSPERVDKLQILATRAFESMKGVSQQAKSSLNRILTDGMANGSTTQTIAKQIKEELNMDLAKANRIARTEITHAHAEAQLESFEALNVDEVSVEAEWLTAEGACQACEGMAREGPYPVSEAHGLIPYHPNCRCAWIPSIVTTNARLTKTGKMDGRAGRDADGDGILDEKNKRDNRGSLYDRVKKAYLAKVSHKAVNKKVRSIGDYWGDTVIPKLFGVEPTGRFTEGTEKKGRFRALDTVGIDNKGLKHAIETKTVQPGKNNNRVDFKTNTSRIKKEKDFKKFKFDRRHMIVIDLRGRSPAYYYSSEWGAFSMNSPKMIRLKGLNEYKRIISNGQKLKQFTAYHKATS
jgi:SPP1 gp7 family putative phage head morphogenesis protein